MAYIRERNQQPIIAHLGQAPQASAANIALLLVGLAFAFVVISPKKQR